MLSTPIDGRPVTRINELIATLRGGVLAAKFDQARNPKEVTAALQIIWDTTTELQSIVNADLMEKKETAKTRHADSRYTA